MTDDVALDERWRYKAECRGVPVSGFFVENQDPRRLPTRDLCDCCEVRLECLDYAQQTKERYGIWGGLSRSARIRRRTYANNTREEMRKDIEEAVNAIAADLAESTEPVSTEWERRDYVSFLFPAFRALALA